jgi:DNA-binding NtrC family response regulator
MKPTQQRILCIDNNASSRLAVYLLERAGYEVTTTSSIADAIALIDQEHFDVHLLNHELVGLEIDSCERLHKFALRTPILFYSTVLYPYEQIEAIHCHQHGHSMEPVNVTDVVGHASRLLKKKTTSVDQPLRRDTEIKAAVTA